MRLWVLSFPLDKVGNWQSLTRETASLRVWDTERRRSREREFEEEEKSASRE